MKKLKVDEAEKLLIGVLVREGLNEKDARTVAEDYLEGELSGHITHGLMNFPGLIKKRGVCTDAQMQVVRDEGAYAYIDAGKAHGQLSAERAREIVVKKAKEFGVAVVGCAHSRSFLRPGLQAEKIATHNLVGIVVNNGGRASVVPFGSVEGMFGTNPIGIGIPTKDGLISADFASAKKAMSEYKLAKLYGREVQSDTYRDEKGNFTTDPDEVSTVLPFGGYKGYIIALLVEVLTGSLLGMEMGKKTNKLRGSLFIAIDPSKFTDLDQFLVDNTCFAQEIRASKKEEGVEEITVPGDRSRRHKEMILSRGYFEISEKLYDELCSL